MKNIYVGNLSFDSSEDELRSAFEAFGAVDKVTVVRDRDTGQPRGFAFVEMPNDAEAESAISGMNGQTVRGRALNVNEARPREARGPRPGGGGFRGERGGGGGRQRRF